MSGTPTIDGVELDRRHAQFIADVRHAVSARQMRRDRNTDKVQAAIKTAQTEYAEWFRQHGVALIFPE